MTLKSESLKITSLELSHCQADLSQLHKYYKKNEEEGKEKRKEKEKRGAYIILGFRFFFSPYQAFGMVFALPTSQAGSKA